MTTPACSLPFSTSKTSDFMGHVSAPNLKATYFLFSLTATCAFLVMANEI